MKEFDPCVIVKRKGNEILKCFYCPDFSEIEYIFKTDKKFAQWSEDNYHELDLDNYLEYESLEDGVECEALNEEEAAELWRSLPGNNKELLAEIDTLICERIHALYEEREEILRRIPEY